MKKIKKSQQQGKKKKKEIAEEAKVADEDENALEDSEDPEESEEAEEITEEEADEKEGRGNREEGYWGRKKDVISGEHYELLSGPLGQVKKDTGAEERLLSILGCMKTLGQKVEERETINNQVRLSKGLVSNQSSNRHGHYMQSTPLISAGETEDARPNLSTGNNQGGLNFLGPQNYTQT